MKHQDLREGKRCYYCNNEPIGLKTKFGLILECPHCKAYVSTDKHTCEPKGSLADGDLRRKRRIAHIHSDDLIKKKIRKDNVSYEDAKEALYNWLSKEIKLDFNMVSIAQLFPRETDDIIVLMEKYSKR